MPNPKAPVKHRTAGPARRQLRRRSQRAAARFPTKRLQRLGAGTRQIEAWREEFDGLDVIEQEAAVAEMSAMSDDELRRHVRQDAAEQGDEVAGPRVPELESWTVPEVKEWVGESSDRARLALEREVATRERKSLVGYLERRAGPG